MNNKNIKFTKNEYTKYRTQQNKCKFSSPEDEYEWAKKQFKNCSKCDIEFNLTYYIFNTSGSDAFDKNGFRLRRPECKDCTNKHLKSRKIAKQKRKVLNLPNIPSIEETCGICNKKSSTNNSLVFDHDHKTNEFRGYLYNNCNKSLGRFNDNIDGLIKCINYLQITDKCVIIQDKNGKLTKK